MFSTDGLAAECTLLDVVSAVRGLIDRTDGFVRRANRDVTLPTVRDVIYGEGVPTRVTVDEMSITDVLAGMRTGIRRCCPDEVVTDGARCSVVGAILVSCIHPGFEMVHTNSLPARRTVVDMRITVILVTVTAVAAVTRT